MTDRMSRNSITLNRVGACMVIMLTAAISVFAQGKVTLKLTDEPLPKALQFIEQQGGKSIIFSVNETEKYMVNMTIENATQADAIDSVLRGKPFVAKEREEYFVIQKQELESTIPSISGTVVDEKSNPLPYCNILLLTSDSVFIDGCVTKEDGSFTISDMSGQATILKISFIGYKEDIHNLSEIHQKLKQQKQIYRLYPTSVSLKELSVTANHQPFTIKDGNIVFNPSFVAYATNANDIIRQVPGVIDTGTSLIMPGKDAIKIYINNKEQRGSLNDVLLLLKSYPASDVEAVEVILNPSSQYTMGQNVGVINIKLKKKPNDYLGGNTAYSFSYDTKASNEGSAGLFYQGKQLNTSFNIAGDLYKYDLSEKNTVGFSNYSRLAQTDITRTTDDIVLRWDMNYQMTDRWNAGMYAYYAQRRMKQDAIHRYNYLYCDGRNETEFVNGQRTDNSDTYLASFDLEGKLSEVSSLSFNIDYYHKKAPTTRTLHYPIDESLILHTSDDIESDNITSKINYNLVPSTKLSFNLGFDAIITNSRNTEKGIHKNEEDCNEKFKYNEIELDLYSEAQYKFTPQWLLRGSVRYQSRWTKAETLWKNPDSRHFNIVCPSAFLSFLIKDNQSIQLGFYYNINRPTLTSLNPTELYLGNNTYRKGNPELKHSKHYVTNLTYSVKNLIIQPYIEWNNNGITEISMLQENERHMMTWENAVDRCSIGLMTFYSYSKQKWMRTSMTAFLSNSVTTSNHPLLQSKASSLQLSLHPNLQFYFDTDREWILSIFGYYITPEHTVDMNLDSLWKLSTSVTWKSDKGWTVSAIGQDLLYSHTRGTQYIGNSTMKFDNQYIYTGVQLSVSYAWGKSMKRSMDRAVLRDMNARTTLD